MPLFLTILEGERPEEAEPLIVTGDERLINTVMHELIKRIAVNRLPQGNLQLVPDSVLVQEDESELGDLGDA